MISQTDAVSKNNTRERELASCRNFIFCNLLFCNSQLTLFPRKKERFHKAGTGPSQDKDTVKCQNESTQRRSQSSFFKEMFQDSIRSNIVLFLESKMIKSPN